MDIDRKTQSQRITLSLYSLKDNGEKNLFGTWPIYTGRKYIIGRGKEADISINSLMLSRKQIELVYYSNNLILIKDLGSRNGTFINNFKVLPYKESKLTSKDRLSFGNQNNIMEFHENLEKRKSIFEEKANGSIFENKNSNINNRIIENQFVNQRENTNIANTRINSLPQKKRDNLNVSSDSRDTEIHRNNFTKNDNLNNNSYRKIQDNYRDNLNNRYRPRSPKTFNYQKTYYNENNQRVNDYYNNNQSNQKRFIGRKLGRNINNYRFNYTFKRYDNRFDNGMVRRRNYYQNRKLGGMERLKSKIERNNNGYANTEGVKYNKVNEEFEKSLINLLNDKDVGTNITLKENKTNGLELVMPIKDNNLMELKKFKKTKLNVNGFLDLKLD